MGETILLQTKEQVHKEMLDFMTEAVKYDTKEYDDKIISSLDFNDALVGLRFIDKSLEMRNYTEVHPSRYQLVKLIEKAEGFL